MSERRALVRAAVVANGLWCDGHSAGICASVSMNHVLSWRTT